MGKTPYNDGRYDARMLPKLDALVEKGISAGEDDEDKNKFHVSKIGEARAGCADSRDLRRDTQGRRGLCVCYYTEHASRFIRREMMAKVEMHHVVGGRGGTMIQREEQLHMALCLVRH